ncbi:MAG: Asp-tRNA(Asn)/Glu-tRNA(Gln) amidotransferase subunit GatC [Saprospiraceae bacterium]|nr:Asp-tRNA(Asn)/Glu-tRNA(Gln) amidotransferase subunit GatC [Saprospiraceae bacterium]
MKIDDTLIQKLETLSKLKLEDKERIILQQELQNMVEMFAKISEVDTTGIEPLRHITSSLNMMREDVGFNTLTQIEALKNAPAAVNQYFSVPKVIE